MASENQLLAMALNPLTAAVGFLKLTWFNNDLKDSGTGNKTKSMLRENLQLAMELLHKEMDTVFGKVVPRAARATSQ